MKVSEERRSTNLTQMDGYLLLSVSGSADETLE